MILIVVRVQYPFGDKYQVSFHISNNYMSESNLVLILTSRRELSNMNQSTGPTTVKFSILKQLGIN